MYNRIKSMFKTIKQAEYYNVTVDGLIIERIHYDTYKLPLKDMDNLVYVQYSERDNYYSFYWDTKDSQIIFKIEAYPCDLGLKPELMPLHIDAEMIYKILEHVEKLLEPVKEKLKCIKEVEAKQIEHRKALELELFPKKKFANIIRKFLK